MLTSLKCDYRPLLWVKEEMNFTFPFKFCVFLCLENMSRLTVFEFSVIKALCLPYTRLSPLAFFAGSEDLTTPEYSWTYYWNCFCLQLPKYYSHCKVCCYCLYTECEKNDTVSILIIIKVLTELKIWLHQNIHPFRKFCVSTLKNNVA